jgi:hypothetical protein
MNKITINYALTWCGCQIEAANGVEVSVCRANQWATSTDDPGKSSNAFIRARGPITDKEKGETCSVKWIFAWPASDTERFAQAIDAVLAPDENDRSTGISSNKTVYKKWVDVSKWLRVGIWDHFFADRENDRYAILQFRLNDQKITAKFPEVEKLREIHEQLLKFEAD